MAGVELVEQVVLQRLDVLDILKAGHNKLIQQRNSVLAQQLCESRNRRSLRIVHDEVVKRLNDQETYGNNKNQCKNKENWLHVRACCGVGARGADVGGSAVDGPFLGILDVIVVCTQLKSSAQTNGNKTEVLRLTRLYARDVTVASAYWNVRDTDVLDNNLSRSAHAERYP